MSEKRNDPKNGSIRGTLSLPGTFFYAGGMTASSWYAVTPLRKEAVVLPLLFDQTYMAGTAVIIPTENGIRILPDHTAESISGSAGSVFLSQTTSGSRAEFRLYRQKPDMADLQAGQGETVEIGEEIRLKEGETVWLAGGISCRLPVKTAAGLEPYAFAQAGTDSHSLYERFQSW